MPDPATTGPARRRPLRVGLGTLLLGLALTLTVTLQRQHADAQALRRQLGIDADAMAQELRQRLRVVELGMLGARSVVLAAGGPGGLPFGAYQYADDLAQQHPDVRGFGVVRRLRTEFDGAPLRYLVEYVDPVEPNRHLLELDLRADPELLRLADAAASGGQTHMSAPRRAPDGEIEFLTLMPLQRRADAEADWVLASVAGRRIGVGLARADGATLLALRDLASDTDLLPGSRPECGPPVSAEVQAFSRRWALSVCASDAYREHLQAVPPRVLLGVGTLASSLLALLAYSVRQGRDRRSDALRQRLHLATLVAQTRDAVMSLDADGRLTSWNAAAQQLFDRPQEQVLGRRPAELLLPPEALDAMSALCRAVLAGETPAPLDMRWVRRGGALLELSVSAAPLPDSDGRVAGMLLSLRDVASRLRLERELQTLNDSLADEVATRTAELEAARSMLQGVIDGVPSLVSYFDRELVCRFANRAHREWLDQDPQALPGRPFRELVDADTFARVAPVMQHVLDGHDETVYRDFPRPDGGTRRVVAHYRPDRRGDGVHGVFVLIQDVDELHRSRQALAAERARLANIVQGTGAGTWEWDLASGRVSINERMAQMLGRSAAQGLQMHADEWRSLTHPDDLPEAWRRMVAHFKGETPLLELESRQRRPDGSWFWSRASGRVAARAADGRALDMNGILLDVTAERQAQQELQDNERRFRFFAANVEEGIMVAEQGVIIDVSEVWARMFGCRVADAVGRSPLDYTAPVMHAEVARRIAAGDSDPYDSVLQRADGSTFPARVRGRTVQLGDRTVRLTTVLDITERKQTEDALHRARAEAERASRAKSQFLANMSHEIRTPLNAVIGLTYLFQDSALDPAQRALADKIQLAGRTLLALINDVLDLSKIEAGELRLDPAPMHLPGLLDEVQRLLSLQAEAKGLQLRLELGPGLPVQVVCDELRLRQILVNLVGNAIKFTERGQVTLRAAPLPGSTPQRARVRLDVVDTGIGIAPELQPQLFRPFTQVDASSTRRFKGTGLGLSIVRELVQLMDGTVSLESRAGAGSTFRVELSLDTTVGAEGGDVRPLSVLLAEDDEHDRAQLEQLSRQLGWLVESVADGDALVRRALERQQQGDAPDALLVDWRMPGRDGLSALAELARGATPQALPAAVVVSVSDAAQVMAAPGATLAAAVLTKPVNPSTLFNAVNSAVARRSGSYDRLLATTRMDLGRTQWLHGLKLLVVDDSDVNLEVARHLLQRQGAEVDSATDGEQALQMIGRHRYDAVLMDVQMPVLDGNEATRRLRRDPGLARLPVIALTAGALSSERQLALEAGMSDFLTKPLDPPTLVRTLRRQVERARGQPLPVQSRDAPAAAAGDDWPVIGGIDAAESRERLGGDRALFLRLLRRLVEDYPPLLQAGPGDPADPARWAALMHRLRGGAGNIAARELHHLATEAEAAAGRPGASEALDRLVPAVARALARLAEDAAPWLRPDADAPLPPGGPAPAAATLSALRGQLQRRDLGVLDALGQLAPELRAWLGSERHARLQRLIDTLDFAGAEALLAEAETPGT
ncbi:MAG: PAS domain S-box protein [Rubrivivax sp.]